jgi:peptidylprolyl isomerase
VPARRYKRKDRNVADDGMTTTPSGLQYRDEAVGEGAEARAGQTVSVHYTGTLTDGTKFDSSRDRGQPFQFPLGGGRVIQGWDEGVAGMKVGGRRRLVIPANLGYGSRAIGPIPPNSTLVFDVELLGVG